MQTSGLWQTAMDIFICMIELHSSFKSKVFYFLLFNSISLSNDLRYYLVHFYRPRGLSSHCSFHYFSSVLLLMRTLTSHSPRSIFGCFFFYPKESSPSLSQLDPMNVQNRLARLLLVNIHSWTSVIFITAVCHCLQREVQGKCGSQMSLHKCYHNKKGCIYCALLFSD